MNYSCGRGLRRTLGVGVPLGVDIGVAAGVAVGAGVGYVTDTGRYSPSFVGVNPWSPTLLKIRVAPFDLDL